MARKQNPEDFQRRLSELQAIYGSQKAAAKKLGVSPKTFSNYRTGKTAPRSKEVYAKANRLRGNAKNAEKLTTESAKKKLEKIKKVDTVKSNKPNFMSLKQWIQEQLIGVSNLIKNEIERISQYAAFNGSDNLTIQFWNAGDPTGKPAGRRTLKSWAIYGAVGSKGGELEIYDSLPRYLIGANVSAMDRINSEWSIQETNDYIEDNLGNPSRMKGRQRYTLTRYLGYQII